ncbi:hypothetical protein Ciccas_006524 [Cichlidogyrus casuarinus]|uniref:Uncharacterized protein n=1 Tax=Cichlidogyrus casuarinus TaxID=1844966 RepID=A0ABD2Q5J7_9PLAT
MATEDVKKTLSDDVKAVGDSISKLGIDLVNAVKEDPTLQATGKSIKEGVDRVFDTSSADAKAAEEGREHASLGDRAAAVAANVEAEFNAIGSQIKEKFEENK